MKLETLKDMLYLASLFHDIGKFRQRGKLDEDLKERIRKEFSYEIESDSQKRGIAHEYVGAYVYKNSELPFKEEVPILISHHHGQLSNSNLKTEYDVLTRLLTISDRISASEREEQQQTFSERKMKLMRSIISSVLLKGETKPPYYKPISRFSKFESLLDKDQAEEYDHEEDYERLWKEFEELISQGDLLHSYEDKEKRYLFFERIYHLLKEYTSNIPSAYYYSEPNVSLFSHAVSTAAIAISLFKQFEDELFEKSNDRFVCAEEKFNSIERLMRSYGSLKNNQPLPDDEPVLGIIKGDVSGIQNFIYNVPNAHGLKKLRGRSFFIAYLAEVIARYIVEQEGLYISNILFCGGGHFYVLVPAKTICRLDAYQKNLDEKLFKTFNLDLNVLLVGKELRLYDLLNFNVHEQLSQQLESKKNKKFSSILNSILSTSVDMSGPICPYCGRNLSRKQSTEELECEFCESFAHLGAELVKKKYMKLLKTSEIENPRSAKEVFQMFGYMIEFTDDPDEFSYALNKDEFDPKKSMYFVKTANYVSKELVEGMEKTTDLETMAERAKGVKRWGILRGDLDNLGKVFASITNVKENQKSSISMVSTLSSEVELFFSVELEKFVAKEFRNCNVVYSGGDDFMILGPWNELPMLSQGIAKHFADYSRNEELSISMAVAIAPSRKYPVYKLGVEAGEMLEKLAKSYTRNGLEKSALAVFGGCIGWEEFADFLEKKKLLEKIVEDHDVTKNFIQTLKVFVERQKKKESTKIWQLYYYVARLIERQTSDEAKKDIQSFFNGILVGRNRLYEKLDLLLEWVHNETRKEEAKSSISN